jgi:hypothetical protein
VPPPSRTATLTAPPRNNRARDDDVARTACARVRSTSRLDLVRRLGQEVDGQDR